VVESEQTAPVKGQAKEREGGGDRQVKGREVEEAKTGANSQ